MTQHSVPTHRPLNEVELQALICRAILRLDADGRGYVQAPTLIQLDGVAELAGIPRADIPSFVSQNLASGHPRILSEFVNRLISRGILSREWEQSHSDVFYFVTRYGREALRDIASLLQFENTEFIETLEDPQLRERCGETLARTTHHDSMVRDAIAVLEDRLRRMPGVEASGKRRDIAVKALSSSSGVYVLGDDEGQQESAQLLYQGILGFYGNPFLHGLQDIEPHRARQIVGFIDNLLHLLSIAQRKAS